MGHAHEGGLRSGEGQGQIVGTPSPVSGFGLGLRVPHYAAVLEHPEGIDWLEIITENYLVPGGSALRWLDRLRERFPLGMHGVSLSIGSGDELDMNYLRQVRALAARIEPSTLSDHLCWTGVDGRNLHDLLPFPYTEEALRWVSSRVDQVQQFLGRQILLENVSSYLSFQASEMQEWEFLSELAQRTDCGILLDVNNVYVSAVNLGFEPARYLEALPAARVRQFHLGGHSDTNGRLIDTHGAAVAANVWKLYAQAIARFGSLPVAIERDSDIPELSALVAELDAARSIAAAARPARQAA